MSPGNEGDHADESYADKEQRNGSYVIQRGQLP